MSLSIESTVGAALALETYNTRQSIDLTMLRKTLDIQSSTMAQLMQAVGQPAPTPATSGTLGTNINTYA